MARKQRSPMEAAVSESLFFKLPLELPTDIYQRLLVQEEGMSIPTDILKRNKSDRQCSRPHCCQCCFAVFSNAEDLCRHSCSLKAYGNNKMLGKFFILEMPSLPHVSTSILRVCRLAHLEASPILYTKNAFYFSNPAAIPLFLWNADRTQAPLIQEIIVTIVEPYSYESPFESQFESLDPWLRYVANKKAGLRHDLPCLRRVIINLGDRFRHASFYLTLPVFQCLSQSIRGLDWVHLNGLNDERLLSYLEPMVLDNDDSRIGRGQVQSHVTDIDESSSWRPLPDCRRVRKNVSESSDAIGWKHVTIWSGTSRVPYHREPSEPPLSVKSDSFD